jgi:signal transduction histidine kinase
MPMGKKKKEKSTAVPKRTDDFGHEIWGIVFIATALLILIALVSHFIAPHNNILGYYLGTALASGLIYFLGPICVFCFPVAVGILGFQRFRGELLNFRILLFGVLITGETCLFLAIHHLPHLHADPTLSIPSNQIGIALVRIIRPVFGPHVFGPYFISVLILAVTVLSAFRISPQKLFGWINSGVRYCIDVFKVKWAAWKEERAILKAEQEERDAERRRMKEEQRKPETSKDTVKPTKPAGDKPVSAAGTAAP